jgi:PPOX class probable F420-dependent enzyme
VTGVLPDASTEAGRHALDRLGRETIGWLTTVNPDGQPQSSPIWFLWSDGELLLYSHRRAPRNANIEDRPLVAFNLETDPNGDDVVTMEGIARFDASAPRASANPDYLVKYRSAIDGFGWSVEYFEAEYPFAIRITPTRWRIA